MGGAVRSSLEAALGLLRCTAVSRSSFIRPFGRPGLKSDITFRTRISREGQKASSNLTKDSMEKKTDGKDAEEGEGEKLLRNELEILAKTNPAGPLRRSCCTRLGASPIEGLHV
ncbi:hypothetical protein K438DRAFT_1931789 [Mycena galopus ATCC 62051]|nr:hypothetical protein K438DRAFT_1931789 [Mycena galopus ATCC 62051]